MRGFQAIAVVLALYAVGAGASTIQVPGEQATIQAGIDAANDGDTVLVADGTYTGPGNRELDFHGKAITVRSAGSDPELCVIDCADAESYTGFYFHSGEDSTSVLAGFTIKNGVATHCEGSLGRYVGGGIFCDAGSAPVLRNLILRENSAGFGGAGLGLYLSGAIVRDCRLVENGNGGAYVDGGAIFAGCQIEQNAGVGLDLRYSDAQILGCTVSGNEFHVFGGILIEVRDCSIAASMHGHESSSIGFYDCSFSGDLHYFYESSLWFYNCSFLACPSGALLFQDAWFAMEDCLLADNSAANGGAIRVAGDCSGRIERTRFANNVATGGGGAIFADCPNELELIDCEFLGNVAGGGGGGGAISFISWLAGPVLSLTRCTLAGNSALGGSPGGAIAGIMDANDSVQLVDCLLTGNYSEGDGGGLFLTRAPYLESALLIAGSTLSGNRCLRSGGGIAGVELTSAELSNSILWGNCAGVAGDQLSMSGAGATVDFTCCVVDSAGVAAGTAAYDAGTYFGDPRFCSLLPCGEAPFLEFAGFTVEAGSPCLPEHNDCGVLIGALGQGCTQVAAPDQPMAVRPLLAQNHPNPFNARTSIVFSLPQAGPAGLRIYDPAGRVRRVLLAGVQLAAGPHRLDWDGRDGEGEALPSGVYLYRLQTPWGNLARKMTLLQ